MKTGRLYILNSALFFVIISLSGLSIIYNYQQLVTYGFIPLLLIAGFSLNQFKFISLKNTYTKYFLSIIILGLFLTPICEDSSTGLSNIITLVGVLFCILFTVEFLSYKPYDFTKVFLLSFVFAFIVISIYLIVNPNTSNININDSYIDRSQFDLNANIYSYFSYFGNMALFYLIQIKGKRIYILLSLVCLALGIFISFITVSRSGMLFTLLIGICYWLFIFDKVKLNPVLKTLLAVAIFIYGLSYLIETYENSFLKLRVDRSLDSGDSREILAREAIEVFLTHPFTGVGPGQFYLYAFNHSSFSHNSYTEIAANFGILGILILLVLLIRPLLKEFYHLCCDKSIKKLNILYFSSFILINNIYVFYLTTYGMIFFFIILMIQKKNFRKNAFK